MNEPTTPPPDEAQIQTEIATLRMAPYAINESLADRTAKIEVAYKQLYPETASGAPARTDPATLALPDGPPWDRTVIAKAFDAAQADGYPRHLVTTALALIDHAAKDPTRYTPTALDDYATREFGPGGWNGVNGVNVRAGESLAALPPFLRAAIQGTGLLHHPRFVEHLAGPVYDHLFDPRTPKGEARLRERYE